MCTGAAAHGQIARKTRGAIDQNVEFLKFLMLAG